MLTFSENREGEILGQMFAIERKLIYDIVKTSKPNICVECGTWKGGGSTFYISTALMENKNGKLHTWETDPSFYNTAINFYNSHLDLKEYIEFNNSDFVEGIKKLSRVDFALLDGPDFPDYMTSIFDQLNKIMPIGSNVIMHDWKEGKCCRIRPLLKNNYMWEIVTEILETDTGMVHIKKIGD